MSSFAFKPLCSLPNHHGHQGMWNIERDGEYLIQYQYWAFRSCASACLMNFTTSPVWSDTVKFNEFVEFLRKEVPVKGGSLSGYNAKEFYMLFSRSMTSYSSDYYEAILKSPLVKKIDTYANKAHGGALVSLYRLSLAKDFPA